MGRSPPCTSAVSAACWVVHGSAAAGAVVAVVVDAVPDPVPDPVVVLALGVLDDVVVDPCGLRFVVVVVLAALVPPEPPLSHPPRAAARPRPATTTGAR